jgi:two-component system nitrate/nitrite response regulator NarL
LNEPAWFEGAYLTNEPSPEIERPKVVDTRLTGLFRAPVRLLIADDQPVVLHGLISLVGSDRSFSIVASCSNGIESISIIRTLRPDVALLDMSMPGLDGLEILAIVRAEDLPTRIVFLTESIQDHDLTSAAVCGPHGIVFKDCSPDALLHGLRAVARGREWLPTALIDGAVQSETEREDRSASFDALTDREREVIRLAAEGLSNKEIARHLNVCDGTIKVHLQNVYRKVAVRNRTALTALAISYRGELSGLGVTARRPLSNFPAGEIPTDCRVPAEPGSGPAMVKPPASRGLAMMPGNRPFVTRHGHR